MTQALVTPYIAYVTDGVLTTFAYPWYIAAASELEAWHNGSITTAYAVTDVGTVGGGTLVFFTPPSAGVLFIRRRTPQTQLTVYTAHDPFPHTTHEAALDKLTRQIQDLLEDLSRRPALPVSSANTLRNLLFPAPVALKLWGWNATGDGITYYDPALVQVTIDTESGHAEGKTVTNVSASSGAGTTVLTAAVACPAGVILKAVSARVMTTCGDTGGLTTWAMGDAVIADRWAQGMARTAGSVTNAGMYRAYAPAPQPNALDILLFAEGGLWDSTGVIRVTAHWELYVTEA